MLYKLKNKKYYQAGANGIDAIGCDESLLSCAAIFLSAKSLEHHKSIRDVINVVDKALQKPLKGIHDYLSTKAEVVRVEHILLRFVGFDFSFELPFKHLLHYARFSLMLPLLLL